MMVMLQLNGFFGASLIHSSPFLPPSLNSAFPREKYLYY